MCWWCSWWLARGCQGFHKEAWWEWDQVHKTWQLYCWLFLKQIHQWQAQKLARDFQQKSKQLGLEDGKIVSDGADFLREVVRKDIREVVRVKRWRKRWRNDQWSRDKYIPRKICQMSIPFLTVNVVCFWKTSISNSDSLLFYKRLLLYAVLSDLDRYCTCNFTLIESCLTMFITTTDMAPWPSSTNLSLSLSL